MQLSQNSDPAEIKAAGFDSYYVDHGLGIYPASAAGVPFTASYLQSKGDPITDLSVFIRCRISDVILHIYKALKKQIFKHFFYLAENPLTKHIFLSKIL